MRALIRIAALLAVVGAVAAVVVTRPQLTAAERGRRLAETWGCFTCHGPGGIRGVPNHNRTDKTVPGFEGDVMMYADDDEGLREWIHDGVTKRRAPSHTWQADRDRGALRMPAFGRRLSSGQIDDLVEFVKATAGEPEPQDTAAAAGLHRADVLGCTGCHGPGGRLAARDPGSLKGYVPPWDGRDFPELVHDRSEFQQWVESGISDRFKRDALARYFLRRAALHMPAFRSHLGPGDVDSLWAYVTWLRRTPH